MRIGFFDAELMFSQLQPVGQFLCTHQDAFHNRTALHGVVV